MRFKCNCYNYKTDFIIPSFNVKTGNKNPFITFSDGTKVYYEQWDLATNKTTVSFGVKKHNRNKFEEAVEEQLLYFLIHTISINHILYLLKMKMLQQVLTMGILILKN